MPKFLPLTNSTDDKQPAADPAIGDAHTANGSEKHSVSDAELKTVDVV
jgi:hypothetical protein